MSSETISKCIAGNYKHGGPKMGISTKMMDNPIITIPETPEDNVIWGNLCKETKMK